MGSCRKVGVNEHIATYGAAGHGRDYTSLAVWEVATDNDLVSSAQSEVLECHADAASFADSVLISDATTSASYFRIVRPAAGQGHDGTPNTGVKFSLGAYGAFGAIFNLNEDHSQVQDLIASYPSGQYENITAFSGNGISGNHGQYVGCIAIDVTSLSNSYGFGCGNNNVGMVDCLAVRIAGRAFNLSSESSGAYNCTAIDSGYGFICGGTSGPRLKNCLARGSTTADFSHAGSAHADAKNNASGDGTADGTNSRTNQTFTFEDAGNDDYHLADNDGGARTYGADLSGDGVYSFNDDVDHDTRSGSWDIGFDQTAPGLAAEITESFSLVDVAAAAAETTIIEAYEEPLALGESIGAALFSHLEASLTEPLGVLAEEAAQGITPELQVGLTESLASLTDQAEIGAADWGQLGSGAKDLIILVDIETPTGWERVSDDWVRYGSPGKEQRLYLARVTDFGIFERSISAPVSFPRISDGSIRLSNHDGRYSQLFAVPTMKAKTIRAIIGPAGGNVAAFLPILVTAVIDDIEWPEAECLVKYRDATFDFLERDVPNLMSTDHWPNLPETPQADFANIVLGTVRTIFGAAPPIKCPLVDKVNWWYCYSRHLSRTSSNNVFRKLSGEDAWNLVPTSEYEWKTDVALYGGFATVAHFFAPQADGTEIAADGEGFIDAAGNLYDNFADCVLAILETVGLPATAANYDLGSFAATKASLAADGITCDGLWSEPLNFRQAMEHLLTSGNLDLYPDSKGRLALRRTAAIPSSRSSYDDLRHILEDSFHQQMAPVCNRLLYSFALNHVTGKYDYEQIPFENEADQAAMGGRIIEDTLELHFVRDPDLAEAIVAERMSFLDSESWRGECGLPAPEVLPEIDLSKFVDLTHPIGLATDGSGFKNQTVKLTDLVYDVQNHVMTAKWVRMVRFQLTQGFIDGRMASLSRGGPHIVGRRFFGVFLDSTYRKLHVWYSWDAGANWAVVDDAGSPSFAANVSSYDSCLNKSNWTIECSTQECPGGRLARHVFDTTLGKWTRVDEQILAAAPYTMTDEVFSGASIEVRSQSFRPVIEFWAGRESVDRGDGIFYDLGRVGVAWLDSSGAWHTQIVTPPGSTTDYSSGRAAASAKDDRVWLLYSGTPTVLLPMWPREFRNSLGPSEAVEGEVEIHMGNLVYYPGWGHNWGAPAAWVDADDPLRSYVALPFKGDGQAALYLLAEHAPNDPQRTSKFKLTQTGIPKQGSGGLDHHNVPAMAAAAAGGTLYVAWGMTVSVMGDAWEVLKKCEGNDPNYPYTVSDSWLPDLTSADWKLSEVQAYPAELEALQMAVQKFYGVPWIAKFSWGGGGPSPIMFELLNISTDVPRS